MTIKDLEKRREAARLRKQKQRREGVTAGRDILESVTSISGEGVTLTEGVTLPYHPILRYLVPGERREKMERIVQSLKGHRLFGLDDVLFGIGKVSIGMDTVEELLEATGG